MQILVFYRSLEKSNAIVSSTKQEYENRKNQGDLTYLDLNFVNLDKRNYVKLLTKLEEENNLPDTIYIWFDEEKITEYINEKYPNIKVISFDVKCIKREEGYYGMIKSYKFLDLIISNFKETLTTKKYIIALPQKETIEELYFDAISLEEFLYKNKKAKVVKNVEEGVEVLVSFYEESIANKKKINKTYEEYIKENKRDIKHLEKLIARIQKEYS